jgi:hypothetical protein
MGFPGSLIHADRIGLTGAGGDFFKSLGKLLLTGIVRGRMGVVSLRVHGYAFFFEKTKIILDKPLKISYSRRVKEKRSG